VNVGYAVSGPSSSGVGGLIGLVQSLNTISKSYNSGFVSGYSQIDCLIGDGNSMLISDSFNKAPVSAGNTNLGGLVGRSQTITITNSLNLGSVSGQVTGGFVAIAQQSLFVYNSVNFGDIVANSNQVTCELIT
jgi:hypothetical protein